MRLLLIADTFPPLRTSGAVQLYDLSREIVKQGHSLTIILPSADLSSPWQVECDEGIQVVRLHAPKTKDISYLKRSINEFFMPFSMWMNLRKSPIAHQQWDGIVWYSPSIFHGPLVSRLKRASGCKSYLIIRDIFPNWAVDLELMGRNPPFYFFDAVARYQYSVADSIGVQSEGNLRYFHKWAGRQGRKLEVLQNWLADGPVKKCSISLEETPIAGRRVFVYTGNMGVAQGMDILLDVAERLKSRVDIGFLFVGRGSEVCRLKLDAHERGLHNVIFRDEIHPSEIPGLYAQCHFGLVVLDPRHKSHNIPGKFLTYLQSGLPVLASINAGNDLAELIRHEEVGLVSEDGSVENLVCLATDLAGRSDGTNETQMRCRALFMKLFTPGVAARQIVDSFKK
ncbi:glycosyltransferase family 4 protein [Granulosicoccus antarcticus]|uniref:Glycosyltransferase WbuB n=1 Tax=Granulosicoccus antarcticus IMCC3135 TaxID=1192854 RepID=A0A2Z2NSS8_9GAMM|nr:glycosyltransferase family 4 protein [Granulosicoccus antarcticus]ASJ74572.1 hypothetical protein IMCC3135_22510 [Granulosicoccus antarcticus IMCC3135]